MKPLRGTTKRVMEAICKEWLNHYGPSQMIEMMPGQNVDALMNLILHGYFKIMLEDVEDGINIIGHQLTMPDGTVVEEVRYANNETPFRTRV